MIQGMVVKLIFNAIMKKINEKHNLKKIDKYVNEDNELDIQLRQAQKTMAKQGKYIEELEKDVAILKKDSHTPVKNIEKRIKWLEKKAK